MYSDSAGFGAIKQMLANGHVLVIGTYINSFRTRALSNNPNTSLDDSYAGQAAIAYMDSYGNGGFIWAAYDALRTTSAVPNAPAGRHAMLMSNALYWSTPVARAPKILAEFTVRSARRSQMLLTLGIGDVGSVTPATTWNPSALYGRGGAYAFDGTATAVDGTFMLDFTDLNPTPENGIQKRYFLNLTDSTAGDPLSISAFRITDGSGNVLASSSNAAFSVDATTGRAFVDYVSGNVVNVPPSVQATATPISGYSPPIVNFDASQSSDPDGVIASYHWEFGDSTTGSGVAPAHTYMTPGTYVARLTITDNLGTTSMTSIGIVVNNPNALTAPSGLSASVSARTVNLTWSDNSGNEDGFTIERAPKSKGTPVYSAVGTVSANVRGYSESVTSGTYLYRVKAFKLSPVVSSSASNSAQVRVR